MDYTRGLRACVLGLVTLSLASGDAEALPGVARGQVAIVDSPGHLHAYSTYSGLWTTTPISGSASRVLASEFLGYARTPQNVYCFNSTNDRWIEAPLVGLPLGEAVEGATALAWTTSQIYGISSIWIIWNTEPISLGESVLGGGSAETFGLVWTNQRALAYSASSGQWITQGLGFRPAGAIAREGLGLVWTNQDAFAFSVSAREWRNLDLEAPSGVSATGDGQVGLIWSQYEAEAYSASADDWFSITTVDPIRGGSAGGQTAIIWTDSEAHVFDATRGSWSDITFPSVSALDGSPPEATGSSRTLVQVAPNPARGTTLGLRITQPGSWTVSLYDAEGSHVASREFEIGTDSGAAAEQLWDWSKDRNAASPAGPGYGTYWLRAESAGAVEARRVVLLP